MKKILVLLLLLLFILLAIIGFNTLRFTSKQIKTERLPSIPVAQTAVERLAASIRFQTVSNIDTAKVDFSTFDSLRLYLEKSFPLVHQNLKRERVEGYSLLYHWQGNGGSHPFVLMGHVDVVPADSTNWTHPPFSGLIDDRFVWGRGTLDDKVNVMGILEAVEMLLQEGFSPTNDIYLVFGHDEEVRGTGALAIARLLESRNIQADFVLDEGMVITEGIIPGIDQGVALIGLAEKGHASVLLEAESQGGHSSMPPLQTATGMVAQTVVNLEDNRFKAQLKGPILNMFQALGPEMPFFEKMVFANLWLFEPIVLNQLTANSSTNAACRTTTAATMLQGSPQVNVLPSKASAGVNFRIQPGNTVDDVLQHVRKHAAEGVEVQLIGSSNDPTPVSDHSTLGFNFIAEATMQVFDDVLVAPAITLAATDSRHFYNVSKNVYRFVPMRLKSEDLSRIHGVNERIGINNYKNIIRFYRQLIINCQQLGLSKK